MLVIKSSSGAIHPADLCVWTQVEVDGGYEITNAGFYGTSTLTPLGVGCELGYIGKSGRFVKMSK